MELNEAVAKKVLEIVDAGLIKGLGRPVAGQMCVEAAVCFALGQPHGDEPSCVGRAVRAYKIRLNDANWSSAAARAKGMRRVAIAQLGSDKIDQKEFANEVLLQSIRQILPIALRAARVAVPAHKDALEGAAVACEIVTDISMAISAAKSARAIAFKARKAADAAADADAAAAADAYAYAAAYAYADADADAAAYAYADADADAYADADADAKRDSILSKAAEIAVQALIKCGSLGCQWLALCDAS